MSSSANSTADTESSVASNPRGAKRPLTPDDSPPPVKKRSTDSSWANNDASPKLHLPSISSSMYDSARRASLPTLSDAGARLRHPSSYNSSPLASSDLGSYTFPPQPSAGAGNVGGNADSRRPSVSTDLPNYNYSQSPYPTSNPGLTASTGATPLSGSHFSFNSPLPSASAADPYHRSSAYPGGGDPGPEAWNTTASHIVRPSSTPGHLSSPGSSSLKYQDAMRHASFSNSSPMSSHSSSSQQQHPHHGQQTSHHVPLYSASTRISGHGMDRRGSQYDVPPIKTDQWSFPDDYLSSGHPPSYSSQQHHGALPPSSGLTVSSNMSPRNASSGAPTHSSQPLPPLPGKKRGKLPKETTDFLKAWLHRHSDHPYPSEDEKKQLCHATGLSMSQVSNWMINARRRILAPVHRAASANASAASANNASYSHPRSAVGPGSSNLPGSHLLEARRASMPADSLQLYYPMTLQSVNPGSSSSHPHHHGNPHANHSPHSHSSYSHHPSQHGPPSHHYSGDYLSPRSGLLGGPGTMRSASMSHAPPSSSAHGMTSGPGSHTDNYGRSNSLSLLSLGSGSSGIGGGPGISGPGIGGGYPGQGQGGYGHGPGSIYNSPSAVAGGGSGGSADGSSPYGP
jgi:hypothetical protein